MPGEPVVVTGSTPGSTGATTGDEREVGDLLAACRQGDSASWQSLIGRYERLVFSVALANGLDREDAADVTQTVFLSLLRSIDRIEHDERLASWLMTVARRHAWRVRARKQQELPVTDLHDDDDEADDPIADWERIRAVHDVIEQLDAPCRDLLTALYLDPSEPSYAEISRRLGRAIGGLGPMRARCLQRVRRLMRHEEFQ